MGEDGLNERNAGKLTPAGLAIKVSGHCLFLRVLGSLWVGRERNVSIQPAASECGAVPCWCSEVLRSCSRLQSSEGSMQISQERGGGWSGVAVGALCPQPHLDPSEDSSLFFLV